ncbi:MAG TPA: response regulator [Kofleriaceae bacterium]
MARILVLDDRPDVARAIARMLFDHETAIESDPRAALRRIVGGDAFDIVLVDYNMPEMTGIEVSEALGAAALPRPPIVLIMSGGENVESMFATGRGVLVKPFEGAELRALVSQMLRRSAPAAAPPPA